jgi:hypothetical protein
VVDRYFFSQRLVDAIHMPPALSQSARLLIFERSLIPVPEGLAEGEVDGPDGLLDEPDGVVEDPPVAPGEVAPPPGDGGLLAPGRLGVPVPGLVCAAARAGVNAMTPARTKSRSLFIVTSSCCRSYPSGMLPEVT